MLCALRRLHFVTYSILYLVLLCCVITRMHTCINAYLHKCKHEYMLCALRRLHCVTYCILYLALLCCAKTRMHVPCVTYSILYPALLCCVITRMHTCINAYMHKCKHAYMLCALRSVHCVTYCILYLALLCCAKKRMHTCMLRVLFDLLYFVFAELLNTHAYTHTCIHAVRTTPFALWDLQYTVPCSAVLCYYTHAYMHLCCAHYVVCTV
jgi:hypothetical protein